MKKEIKKVDLEYVLRLYFKFEHKYDQGYKKVIDSYYDSVKRRTSFRVFSKEYNVEARLGYYYKINNKANFWMYVADLEISKEGLRKASRPLHSMSDSEYMFYGMFLNCAAYMDGAEKARLVLVHAKANKLVDFRYRPKMGKELLDHYLEKYVKEEIDFNINEIGDKLILDL